MYKEAPGFRPAPVSDVNTGVSANAPPPSDDARHAAGQQDWAKDGTAADTAPGAAVHGWSVTLVL